MTDFLRNQISGRVWQESNLQESIGRRLIPKLPDDLRPLAALARVATFTFAILVLLAACAQAPPVPKDSFYRLEINAPEAAAVAAAVAADLVVEVRVFDADGILGERALVYVEPDSQTLRQYSLHFWLEPPTHALQNELVHYLRASGYFAEVLTPRFRSGPDIQVLGRISRLEQILADDGSAGVRVGLELGAERTARGGGLLVLRSYSIEQSASDASPAAAASAQRNAVREIFSRFTEDLVKSLQPPET